MDGDGWSRLGGLPRGGDGSKGIQYKGIFWLAWVEWRPWGTQRVSPSIVPSCGFSQRLQRTTANPAVPPTWENLEAGLQVWAQLAFLGRC